MQYIHCALHNVATTDTTIDRVEFSDVIAHDSPRSMDLVIV